jgi:CelD/BcsL family acetyltransferase involved in cellulose biosynthesis
MPWVKGELLSDITASAVDPTGQLTEAHQRSPFDRLDWLTRVLKHQPPHETALIARASSEGALAWLFLKRADKRRFSAIANWYSFAFRPLFAGNPDEDCKLSMLTAIARRLRRMRRAPARIIMQPVPRADGSSERLGRAFNRAGWLVTTTQVSTSWTANVAGLSFDDYWAQRPGQLRNTYKRKLSKADFQIEIHEHFDGVAWNEFESVYADSWKPEEGNPAFLKETAQFKASVGKLRMGLCRIDGRAVAAQFWIVDQGRAHIHKLAHREDARELSPGTILSVALFRHVIDIDKVDIIDFGTGNDAYKADWMDSSAPLDCVAVYNPATIDGLVGALRERLSVLVRKRTQG